MLLYLIRNASGAVCCQGSFETLCDRCKVEARRRDRQVEQMTLKASSAESRCAVCGGVRSHGAATSQPKWVMPDGTTDWATYWASMPESLRRALEAESSPPPRAAVDKRIPPPPRLSERLKTTASPSTAVRESGGVPEPRRLSDIFRKGE